MRIENLSSVVASLLLCATLSGAQETGSKAAETDATFKVSKEGLKPLSCSVSSTYQATGNALDAINGAIGPVVAIAEAAEIIQYGPGFPGPLHDFTKFSKKDVLDTFLDGRYQQVTARTETVLYRGSGGRADTLGKFWTRFRPTSAAQFRNDRALLDIWGNTLEKMVQIRLPAGVSFFEGCAAPQVARVGLGNQVYLAHIPSPAWFVRRPFPK